MLPKAMAERFNRAGQHFDSFHFERAGVVRLRGQAAGLLEFLPEIGAFSVAPRDQDSTCHLRDAFPLDLSGLCHAIVSKIRGSD